MAEVAFPSGLSVEKFTWQIQRMDSTFTGIFGQQSIEGAAPMWKASIGVATMDEAKSGAWQALAMSLNGRLNQLALHNIGRPVPRGTYRGSPLLTATAAQGASSLTFIDATQAGKTLLQGDFLGFGSGAAKQVVMVMADATASGAGQITVSIQPALRNDLAISSPVVWDKPTALFRQTTNTSKWEYSSINVSGLSLDLMEDFRP